jgi:hypothetical protein
MALSSWPRHAVPYQMNLSLLNGNEELSGVPKIETDMPSDHVVATPDAALARTCVPRRREPGWSLNPEGPLDTKRLGSFSNCSCGDSICLAVTSYIVASYILEQSWLRGMESGREGITPERPAPRDESGRRSPYIRPSIESSSESSDDLGKRAVPEVADRRRPNTGRGPGALALLASLDVGDPSVDLRRPCPPQRAGTMAEAASPPVPGCGWPK